MDRRKFLKASAATAMSLWPMAASANTRRLAPTAERVIFVHLRGGPGQLDTFDPKPNAPSDIRGPFQAIPTSVPGLFVSELFPKLAAIADKFAFVRTVHFDEPAIHELGYQWLHTGHCYGAGSAQPNTLATAVHLQKQVGLQSIPTKPNSEVRWDLGLTSAWLHSEQTQTRKVHRVVDFPRSQAVTPDWDYHGSPGCSDFADIATDTAPQLDRELSRLIQNLTRQGLLDSTLVVVGGEFGRTPTLNGYGGRDHWTRCFTMLFAGGGVQGGRVIGTSDANGAYPKDRPVHASDISATIFHALGIDPRTTIPDPAGLPHVISLGRPIGELF